MFLVTGKSSVARLLLPPLQVGAAMKVVDNALEILTGLPSLMLAGSALDHTRSSSFVLDSMGYQY